MQRVSQLAFMMGDVIVPRITDTSLGIVSPGSEVDWQTHLNVYNLETELSIGKITPEEYCEWILFYVGSSEEPDTMVTAIPERAGLLPWMKPLIEELSANFKLRLVSDYPRRWLKRIVENTGLVQYFKDDDTLVLAEEYIPHTCPELFEFMIQTFGIRPGSSLWIDHGSPRTSCAIRQGIDAIVFVDAQRLRRELRMRNLLPKRAY